VNIQIGKQAQQQTPVPRVVGMTVGQAKQTLAQSGFTQIQFAPGSSQDDNAFVIKQDPKDGQQTNNPGGTTVTLTTLGGGGNNNGGNNNGGNNGGLGNPFG
jgi:serine/threonine-protein kinase